MLKPFVARPSKAFNRVQQNRADVEANVEAVCTGPRVILDTLFSGKEDALIPRLMETQDKRCVTYRARTIYGLLLLQMAIKDGSEL